MISVLLTSYNGMAYIEKQVNSILTQLSPEDELVISDNGSTDGTWAYLNQLRACDQRVRLSIYTDKKGIIANINNGLGLVRGDIIYLADQDDIWLENKIPVCNSLFSQYSKLLVLQNNAELVDSDERSLGNDFFSLRDCGPGFWKNFRRNTWQGCNMAFRKELLEIAWPIPEQVPMHDVWLGLIGEMTGDVLFHPEILTYYRRHDENLSSLKPSAFQQIIVWRFRLAAALISKMGKIRKYRKELKA